MTATMTRRARGLRPCITMPTDRAELAYLAGIVDTKGLISPTRSGGWSVQVTSPSRSLLGLFQKIGGRVEDGDRQSVWRLIGPENVGRFIIALLPYLQENKAQAAVCLTSILAGAR